MADLQSTNAMSDGAPNEQPGFQERTLVISNFSAKFAKDKDIIGSQDPYLTMELSGDTVTTSVQKSGGINPTWPETEGYRLHDRGEHPELHIHAWNKNMLLRDSSLGEGKIAMTELGIGKMHTVPLLDKKGVEAGEISFWAKEEQGAGPPGQDTGLTGAETAAGATAAGATGAAAAHKVREEKDAHKAKHADDKATRKADKDARQAVDTRSATQQGAAYQDANQGARPTTYDSQQGTAAGYQGQGMQQGAYDDHTGRNAALAAGAGAAVGAGVVGSQRDAQQETTPGYQDQQGAATDYQGQGLQGQGLQQGAYDNHTGRDAALAAGAGAAVGAGVTGALHNKGETTDATQDAPGTLRTGEVQNGTNGTTTTTSDTGHGNAALAAGAGAAAGAAGAGAVTTTRSTKTTTDTDENESEEYRRSGGIGALNLESGDDHWQKSLDAAAEARRHAQEVEAASQDTHVKMLAAQEATRNFEKARREHIGIQDRLAALDLNSKRSQFEQSTAAYEAAKGKLGGKAQEVDVAQQEANALRAAVNEKGEALDAQVNETKLHQSRLAELEAEIERLTGLHSTADSSHRALLADLEPKRHLHTTLQDEFQRVQVELTDAQRRRATLEAQERELEAQLSTHNSEYENSKNDIAELEAMGRNRAAEAETRRGDVTNLEAELNEVQGHLAEHRQRIGILKQDTEAAVAQAGKLSAAADAKAAQLQASQQAAAQREQEAGAAQAELNSAQQSVQPMYEKVRREQTEVDHHKTVVEELHRKLGTAKEAVDLAQARKEEMWHKAKEHGEKADQAADRHFLASHADHQYAVGSSTYNADDMTHSGSTTKGVLKAAGDKLGL